MSSGGQAYRVTPPIPRNENLTISGLSRIVQFIVIGDGPAGGEFHTSDPRSHRDQILFGILPFSILI